MHEDRILILMQREVLKPNNIHIDRENERKKICEVTIWLNKRVEYGEPVSSNKPKSKLWTHWMFVFREWVQFWYFYCDANKPSQFIFFPFFLQSFCSVCFAWFLNEFRCANSKNKTFIVLYIQNDWWNTKPKLSKRRRCVPS